MNGIIPVAAELEQVGEKHYYIHLPNGWTVSVVWGHSDILAPKGKADVMAFTGKSPIKAAETVCPEYPFLVEQLVAFIRTIAGRESVQVS